MTLRLTIALSALLAGASAVHAAPAEPNITGLWSLEQPPGWKARPGDAPLTAAAAAEAAETARRYAAFGRVIGEAHTKCWPAGMPGLMQPPFGIEFLQTRGRVTILSEVSNLPRTIYLDEKAHPDDLIPGWNGHSIGRWEKGVLVIDTVGFNGRQPRVSPKMHITERIYLAERGKALIDEMTLDDPQTYTRPFTLKYRYKRVTGQSAELMEYVCEVDPDNLNAYATEEKTWAASHGAPAAGAPKAD